MTRRYETSWCYDDNGQQLEYVTPETADTILAQRDALLLAAKRLVSAYLLGDQKLIGEAVLETRDAVAQVENPTGESKCTSPKN